LILLFSFSLLHDWSISTFVVVKTGSVALDVNCVKIRVHRRRAVMEVPALVKVPISNAAAQWVFKASNATKNAVEHVSIRQHRAVMVVHVKRHQRVLTFACAVLAIEETSVN
jgi:hypothetical protein